MGFWRTTGKIIGHVVELRVDHWCDLPWLKKTAVFFWDHLKLLFTSEKAKHSESFDEAVKRLNLTPESLAKQSHLYFLLAIFFAFLTLALLVYASIVTYLGNWMGACISFSLSLYTSTLLFRSYFWHFQITHQKLGCTLRECCQSISIIKRGSQQ